MMNSVPKERLSPYQRVEASLRSRVREGYWVSGQTLPGRRKLAQEYGVALSTIQRAIASLIEDGTLQTDGTLGTFVGPSTAEPEATADAGTGSDEVRGAPGAHSATQTKPIRIGILIANYTPPEAGEQSENLFFGPLFEGMRTSLARDNVYVNYIYRDERSLRAIYQASECDGLIIIAPSTHELFELTNLYQANIPFVALLTSSDATPEDMALPCVDADNRAGAIEAVNHLVGLGHERIGIVNLAVSQSNLFDRWSGYLGAISDAGLTIDPEHMLINSYPWSEPLFEEQIEKWVRRLRERNRLPSAIFSCDLTMTLHTISSLQRHGLRIPEDISLVGFDDTPFADRMSPPMTLVRQPIYQMGRRAATRLLEHLRTTGGRLSGTERLATQLIVRRSTAPPPAP